MTGGGSAENSVPFLQTHLITLYYYSPSEAPPKFHPHYHSTCKLQTWNLEKRAEGIGYRDRSVFLEFLYERSDIQFLSEVGSGLRMQIPVAVGNLQAILLAARWVGWDTTLLTASGLILVSGPPPLTS